MLILGVAPGGAAEKAGIAGTLPTPAGVGTVLGDVIVAIDGAPIKKQPDLYRVLDAHKVGDEVTLKLTLEREGQQARRRG